MKMKAWKRHEKKTALELGGERVVRVNWGEEGPDVRHPRLCIECKYRRKLPEWLIGAVNQAERYAEPGQLPIAVLKERYRRDELVVMKLSRFKEFLDDEHSDPNHQPL